MIMAAKAASLLIYFSWLCLFSHVLCLRPYNLNHLHSDNLGFTADLIRLDSSPETLYRRLSAAESALSNTRGEYLMEISLGTPPFRTLAIADTGSSVTWTQCQPCKLCYNQTLPIFNPKSSSTFKTLTCNSTLCVDMTGQSCESLGSTPTCRYSVDYADGSFTSVSLGSDTLTLFSSGKTPVAFPGFGCGFENQGMFGESGSGIVALGKGKGSLVSQLGSHGVAEMFSYCLVPFGSTKPSKISFGSNAVVSGPGTVSVPLAEGESLDNMFYNVNIKAISVGNKTITFDHNAIIVSGATLTVVPDSLYSQLESAMANDVKLERVADPGNTLGLCYKTTAAEPGLDFPAPDLTVHYGGANVKLTSLNTFVRVSDDVVCFSFKGSKGKDTVVGNLAQIDFLVGYDLVKKTVSFKPTDCTAHVG